jgi:hypothetical protein
LSDCWFPSSLFSDLAASLISVITGFWVNSKGGFLESKSRHSLSEASINDLPVGYDRRWTTVSLSPYLGRRVLRTEGAWGATGPETAIVE